MAYLFAAMTLLALGVRAAEPAPESTLSKLRAEQQSLLKQIRAEFAMMPPLPPYSENEPQATRDHRKRKAELLAILLEIERRINLEADVRTIFASPSAKSQPIRDYYDRLRSRIEDYGTKNFPKHGDTALYGRVHLLLTIAPDGRVVDLEVVDSTSHLLSAHSVRLVRELEPFEAFPTEVRKEADRIVIGTPFNFTKD